MGQIPCSTERISCLFIFPFFIRQHRWKTSHRISTKLGQYIGRKWCRFTNAPTNVGPLPQIRGAKKHKMFDHFCCDFCTQHRISLYCPPHFLDVMTPLVAFTLQILQFLSQVTNVHKYISTRYFQRLLRTRLATKSQKNLFTICSCFQIVINSERVINRQLTGNTDLTELVRISQNSNKMGNF